MRLEVTRKSHLALQALWALMDDEYRLKGAELADRTDASPAFVAQVMTPLVKSGWVDSEPGRSGGYLLTADPDSISVLEVIEAVEGPTDSDWCVLQAAPCSSAERCALHDAWARSRATLMEALAARTVGSGPRQGVLL
jgi:Rrf2 family protein